MIWLYRLLFIPSLILAMPYYAMRMIRRGGYAKDFSHRFGGQKNLPKPTRDKTRFWIQAVSVGEVEAIGKLVDELSARGDIELVVTTTTSTAYKILREKYASKCLYVGVFPMDFWLFSRRAWNKIKPDVCVLMEGELWPEHIHQAKVRGVKLLLLNARMSDRSYARYLKIPYFARRLFEKFSAICVSNELDMGRFEKLGALRSSLHLTGNLKFDSLPSKILIDSEKLELRQELGFAENSLVILGSSTWDGEEEMLLRALDKIRAEKIDCRLLLIPRHAERREQIKHYIEKYPHCVRSESKKAPLGTLVYLADTTGELRMFTQIADLAFVGKSLPPNVGGQTPIDCAALSVPMVYGCNMTNFRAVCQTLECEGASVKVLDSNSAISELVRLSKNKSLREELSAKAKHWHNSNVGATNRTLKILSSFVK